MEKEGSMRINRLLLVLAMVASLAFVVAACGDDDDEGSGGAATSQDSGGGEKLSGTIRIDGSSTVAPLTEAVAEQFQSENPGVKVTVGTSGTGGGFEKFCVGETDISDASRAIEDDEVANCEKNGVENKELRVATDALTVVVNPDNPVECMTVDQLKAVWEPGSKLGDWSQVPDLDPSYSGKLALFGPASTSGTFDYFTGAINGEEGATRKDYNNVGEDDNATVNGVAGDKGGMGYFGFSYYQENQEKVKALQIDGGDGCVAPSAETAQNDSYAPLSRPLFIYPSAKALARPEVDAFLEYYMDNVNDVAESVGFIALTDEQLQESKDALAELVQ
jgi:phosphate transport system substrate-binding protein